MKKTANHSWTIRSDLAEVDTLCRELHKLLACQGMGGHVFSVDLLAREFLNNAIVHGNRSNADARVEMELQVGRKWVMLRITDEGPGFNWRIIRKKTPDENSTTGRGLLIGAQYAHRMQFNQKGNQITLWIRKSEMEETTTMNEYRISRDGAQVTVTLGEILNAAIVPALQPALKQEISTGAHEIVFDLAGTKFLDSTGIGLLIATSNSLRTVQGTVRISNVSPDIYKLFQSMRLVDRLHASAAGKESSHG